MLNELIEAIGYNNILKKISDSIDMINSLYIRIPIDKDLKDEDFLLINKEVEINQLEQSEWFKERELLSKYIMSNKAIVQGKKYYPRIIFSVHKNVIMFKWNKFLKHKNTTKNIEESFKILIGEYLNVLKADEVYLKYYYKNIKQIINFINDNNLTKIKVKMFLDVDIEEYKEDYSRYLKNKLLDGGTTCKIYNELYGRLSQFYTINFKKPLLGHMTKNTNEIHLINQHDVLKIFHLKQYMDSIKSEKICYELGDITYKMDVNSSTNEWFLHKYNNNPYQTTDDLQKNIYIKNILDSKHVNEKIIKHYSELSKYILQLTDFKVKNSYGKNDKKDKIENKFKTFSKMYYKYIGKLNNTNFENFKIVYNNLIISLLRLYIYDEDIYKIQNIINFDICMRDYLFKTNLKEGLANMITKIKEKILKNEKEYIEEYIIEDDKEFFILCGQMAKYLKSKVQTDEKTNKLFYEYLLAKKVERLMDILQRDKARLDYDSNISGRSNKIMYGLLKYYDDNKDNLELIDINKLNMGLYYGDCVLYSSKKRVNDENKKGEDEIDGKNEK